MSRGGTQDGVHALPLLIAHDSELLELPHRPLAGVEFDRQGQKLEEKGAGIGEDADPFWSYPATSKTKVQYRGSVEASRMAEF